MNGLRIAITPGEPAGIGPNIVLMAAQHDCPVERVVIADPELLRQRAAQLQLHIEIKTFAADAPAQPSRAGQLTVLPIALCAPCTAGHLQPANASYVLATLQRAVEGCLRGEFAGMVTAPVNKAVINDAGIAFSGHTEFLAAATNTDQVVMMLATDTLRVALATTHIPLSAVPAAITQQRLSKVLRILQHDLQHHFGLSTPRIMVLGLNPHAGEGGHMGREEIEVITPSLEVLRKEGMYLIGPVPADTAFTPKLLLQCDAVLAMYHDQGLPVLKYQGFGSAVNITLGLPIIRTSVDHGTALELAASGAADPGSLLTALNLAINMAQFRSADTPA